MAINSEFVNLPLERLHAEAAIMKGENWRFIQTHAVSTDEGIDLYYSFMKNGMTRNYRVKGVEKGTPVPSITDLFLAAFVFENEARELFGVDMRDIAIDFHGGLYAPAEQEPMTVITPEQKAARDKARKAMLKASAAKTDEPKEQSQGGFVMTPERQARLDAKMANMSPEKAEKVRAALAARAAEAASSGAKPADAGGKKETAAKAEVPKAEAADPADNVDEALEAKIAAMDPEKAEKVRKALGMVGEDVAEEPAKAPVAEEAPATEDAQLADKLAHMDPAKAEKVRAALEARGKGIASLGGK
ncbi:MAG: NADH-quinone oxidoreductase subunit C [Coriobacteriaceae bacterium]|jgi:hypothetical protein|nr:NADH-quinone oxidoreductase subunit C [Coriobacteriaceae bacterium]